MPNTFCDNVDPQAISSVFLKYEPADWYTLTLYFRSLENEENRKTTVIPEDLLSGHSIKNDIVIECIRRNNNLPQRLIDIHPNAFGAHPIRQLTIKECDLNETKDYSFMIMFYRLTNLNLWDTINMDLVDGWAKLLPLATAEKSYSINQTSFAKYGLQSLTLKGTRMSQSTVGRILKGLLHSPSAKTLSDLSLVGNNMLTSIPEEIKFFSSLNNLRLCRLIEGYGRIPIIKAGSLQNDSLDRLSLWEEINFSGIGLQHIEPSVFKGNYLCNDLYKRHNIINSPSITRKLFESPDLFGLEQLDSIRIFGLSKPSPADDYH